MMWVAWRQFRVSFLVVLGLVVAIAIALLITGPSLFHVYDTIVAKCGAQATNDCLSTTSAFQSRDRLLQDLSIFMLLIPALIGMFWGAPLLAREFESGTYRLAWTQSVTRTRWFLVRVGMVVISAGLLIAALSFMDAKWMWPFRQLAGSPFSDFDKLYLAPVGYTIFAVLFGVLASVALRRTLPAIVATLVGFIAIRLSFNNWIRPHLRTPKYFRAPFELQTFKRPGAHGPFGRLSWITSNTVETKSGRVLGQNGGIGPSGQINFNLLPDGKTYFQGVGVCPNSFPSAPKVPVGGGHVSVNISGAHAAETCVRSFHLVEVLAYQPGNRFWAFQWEEFAFYVALGLLCGALALWGVRRRLR